MELVTVRGLGGEGVSRCPVDRVLGYRDGEYVWADHYDRPVVVAGMTRLRGWGDLDGPAVVLAADGVAWDVIVPLQMLAEEEEG